MSEIRKAVVIGGTGGLGHAIAEALADEGARVIALGRRLPEGNSENIEYRRFNLLSDDFAALAEYSDADALVYAAGLGRIAPYDKLTDPELIALFRTNAEGFARALRAFMPRLLGRERFFCAAVGSIAGLVSSPMFAGYGASKAALASLCESVNAELIAQGSPNRVLHVAPGFLPGTGFYGGSEEPDRVRPIAREIVRRMRLRELAWIPDFEKTYGGVLARYHDDPVRFGVESWAYKRDGGRASDKPRLKVGFLSGTFDLFHIGHLNLLRRAKEYCDYLIVGVHPPGSSHKNKPIFIPLEERMEIVASCKYVDQVVVTLDEDDEMYALYPYDYLFVGSDYKGTERFERYERELTPLGVQIVYFPYTQGTSSTQLREALERK